VLSVLTGTEAVRQVYLGEHGALEASGDRVYVDITTVSPEVHVQVAAGSSPGPRHAFPSTTSRRWARSSVASGGPVTGSGTPSRATPAAM